VKSAFAKGYGGQEWKAGKRESTFAEASAVAKAMADETADRSGNQQNGEICPRMARITRKGTRQMEPASKILAG